MAALPDYLTPEQWLHGVFSAVEVRKAGVLKRQIRDVERLCGQEMFLDQARRLGFQVARNGHHFVVFCNDHPIRRVVWRPVDGPLALWPRAS